MIVSTKFHEDRTKKCGFFTNGQYLNVFHFFYSDFTSPNIIHCVCQIAWKKQDRHQYNGKVDTCHNFIRRTYKKTQVRDSKKAQKTNIFIIQNLKIELFCVKEKEITQKKPIY